MKHALDKAKRNKALFIFQKIDHTYAIIGNKLSKKLHVINIPPLYNGLNVTSISDKAFEECSSLTSIIIPESVTSIGNYAFYRCSSLTSIVIPNSVTSIGYSAFAECSSLTSIVIPNSVTRIGKFGFFGCSFLTDVYYTGTIENWCKILFNSFFPLGLGAQIFFRHSYSVCNPMHYGQHFYMLNQNNEYEEVTEIVIPDTITSIGQYQFYGFNNVKSIVIPDSVTSIGDYAFRECSSLQYNEYGNCYYLGNEENPYLVLVKAKNTSITMVTISENIRFIMDSAFRECSSLTSIVIPDSVTSIGSDAFYNCTSLKTVTFEAGSQLTSIEYRAFEGCGSLTSIVIPDSVTSIGHGAFNGCSSLESITLPFVGAELNGTSNTHFGYIFGASSYSYNSEYVPSSLKEVIITNEQKIDGNAFFDCHFIYRFAHTLSEKTSKSRNLSLNNDIVQEIQYKTCLILNDTNQFYGLGFVLKDHIVTCYHVYHKATTESPKVFMSFCNDDRRYPLLLESYNETDDIALMKLTKDEDCVLNGKNFSYSNDEINKGDRVYGVDHIKINKEITKIFCVDGEADEYIKFVSRLLVKITTKEGNSGGPLLNQNGELIGMLTSKPKMAETITINQKKMIEHKGDPGYGYYVPISTILNCFDFLK